MKIEKEVFKLGGKQITFRTGEERDAAALIRHMDKTRAETAFLLTAPGEMGLTEEGEKEYLKSRAEDPLALELLAFDGEEIVGEIGVWQVARWNKIKHRAEVGIDVERAYWGMGIGRQLLTFAVDFARTAGYTVLELSAVADNDRALALYRSLGFCEYGRLKRGLRLSDGTYQELIYMAKEL